MRLALPSLVLFVLPLACSFDSSGQPEAGSGADGQDDEADVTTGTAESGGESGTDQGTSTTADTGSDEPGTTESTTESTTTESTTDPTTESTTESTTDPTTESTTESTTETTGEDSPPYGTCDSCAVGEICKDSGIEFVLDPWEVCGTPCNDANDCPDAGGSPLTCLSYNLQSKACFIECGNSPCPGGMTCVGVNFATAEICVWQ